MIELTRTSNFEKIMNMNYGIFPCGRDLNDRAMHREESALRLERRVKMVAERSNLAKRLFCVASFE